MIAVRIAVRLSACEGMICNPDAEVGLMSGSSANLVKCSRFAPCSFSKQRQGLAAWLRIPVLVFRLIEASGKLPLHRHIGNRTMTP